MNAIFLTASSFSKREEMLYTTSLGFLFLFPFLGYGDAKGISPGSSRVNTLYLQGPGVIGGIIFLGFNTFVTGPDLFVVIVGVCLCCRFICC